MKQNTVTAGSIWGKNRLKAILDTSKWSMVVVDWVITHSETNWKTSIDLNALSVRRKKRQQKKQATIK